MPSLINFLARLSCGLGRLVAKRVGSHSFIIGSSTVEVSGHHVKANCSGHTGNQHYCQGLIWKVKGSNPATCKDFEPVSKVKIFVFKA